MSIGSIARLIAKSNLFAKIISRRESLPWQTESNNSFSLNKTPNALEALQTLALRVLFMKK
jgi:hypothetical protein